MKISHSARHSDPQGSLSVRPSAPVAGMSPVEFTQVMQADIRQLVAEAEIFGAIPQAIPFHQFIDFKVNGDLDDPHGHLDIVGTRDEKTWSLVCCAQVPAKGDGGKLPKIRLGRALHAWLRAAVDMSASSRPAVAVDAIPGRPTGLRNA